MTADATRVTLSSWNDFYLITGSAAAALTGLQFIVQTLLASREIRLMTSGDAEGGIAAFGSPTVVHFSLALIISAVMCVPWAVSAALRVTLGIIAVCALVYSVIVLRRARAQRSYKPTLGDWAWHVVIPATTYAALLVAAWRFDEAAGWSLPEVAAATLVLICVGIHNAWDTVTYLTVVAMDADAAREPRAELAAPPRNKPRSRKRRR